jgi:hypothetical protein
MIELDDQTRPSVFPSDVPETGSFPSALSITNIGLAKLYDDHCQIRSRFSTSVIWNPTDSPVNFSAPGLGRTSAFFPTQTLQTLVDEGFESFDSTSVGGTPDPVWSIVMELSEALSEIIALAHRAEFSVIRMEALIADAITTSDESADIVVFGEPQRRHPVRGRMIGSRRGEPLIVPEDFDEWRRDR